MTETIIRGAMMRFAIIAACLAVFMMGAAGCAGVPVQEMSNARQAVRAAHDAVDDKVVADKKIPESLTEADSLLSQAETSMRLRNFREARSYALEARAKALEALQNSQPSQN
jgi:hypothetical protein